MRPSLFFALLVPGPPGDPGTARRDRIAGALAVATAVTYGGLMVLVGDATKAGAAIPWQVDMAIGMLCAVPLFWRRRQPLVVAMALLPFGTVSVMATGPILIALFTVAIRERTSMVLFLGLVHVVAGALYFMLQADPPFPLWLDIVMRTITGLAAVGWGMFLRAYRDLARSLRDQAARLVAEQQWRTQQAQLTERAALAREMHDVLAHRLSMVSLQAGALEVRPDATPGEVATAAGVIRVSAHEALEELRTVIGVLRQNPAAQTAPEPPQPGLANLPDLLAGARAAGMTIGYTCLVPAAGPSPLLGRTAYRLVQEGLTNARKHAPDAEVEVLLDGSPGDDLRIRITNPLTTARAWPRLPGSGTGLIGVGERVALIRGRVEYGPADNRFRLEAWLPWPA
jgi:signal transduction histidine kinase